ncbi:MAG: YfhO family protein [Flavobacterium sp.]
MNKLQRFYPHVLAILGFILISSIYFYPVLQGKKMYQSDIVQYTAMAKEQNDFRAENHTEPYWTNSAFGGMPTYQLGAYYPHNYIKVVDSALRFLPRPADYMFLYFLGFYVLLLVMKVDSLKAFFGALAFGFSTYLIIIFEAGHNSKAHAIAYMPLVIAGVLLVYRRKYIAGGLLTLIAAALEINANHFQMTYYLLLFLVIVTIFYTYKFIKNKEYMPLMYCFGTLALAGLFAVGANATSIMATSEYAKESTRGKSELTYNPDGTKNTEKSSMTYEYITQYSYGIIESLNLVSPRIFGGASAENLGTNSAMYQFAIAQNIPEDQAKEIVKGLPTYWGDQPSVSGPAYIGAVVFFLAILALFCDNRKLKYVFFAGALASLLLSWGKNFPILTDFFINYVPMYDIFRAVSSIQVVLEICLPVLAIMGLQAFFKLDDNQKWPNLWKAAAVCVGTLLTLFLFKGSFSFAGANDNYLLESYGPEFIEAIKSDRKSMFSADLLRSAFFIILSFGALWLSIKNTISTKIAIIIVGVLMVSDLFFVDKGYVNTTSFVSSIEVDKPYEETSYDTAILQDKSYYRVFEVSQNAMSDSRASYYHKSIGGYSAVKPRRMQELFDYQIANNNLEVLNMLNVKYLIQTNDKGEKITIHSTGANGNAWFVNEIKVVNSADAEMKALDKLKTKSVAVISSKEFANSVKKTTFVKDTTTTIQLNAYAPNELKYTSNNTNEGFAVFSEMYYKNGWNAYIDGKLQEHLRVDYALRGLYVPAGKHKIDFKFEPQVIQTGGTISLISFFGILIALGGGIYYERKKKQA